MKKVLSYFVLLMALALAGVVAVVSVTGLMKVFAGAGTMGLIFFILIEVSKIVGTSAVHTYKKTIHWGYRYAMMLAIVIAMGITSMGIYGFLSDSYKQASDSMVLIESKVDIIKAKKTIAEEDKTSLNLQIEQKRDRIKSLTEVRKSQETRMDSLSARGQTWSAGKVQKAVDKADENIVKSDGEITILNDKISIVNDSLGSYEIQILELEHNSEGASELNSLKYLSSITGMSMDEVMKWFIFLLILIGDPMAVLFVIYFNKIFGEEDGIEGLPMDALIGDKPEPNGPMDNPETGEVDLTGVKPMERDVWLPSPIIGEVEDKVSFPEAKKVDSKLISLDIFDPKTGEQIILKKEPKLEDKLEDKAIVNVINSVAKEDKVEDIFATDMEVHPNRYEDNEDLDEEVIVGTHHDSKTVEILNVEPVVENTPEEQIDENIEVVKDLKREPVVPRGKIIEEDLEGITNRGFSVPVPDPINGTQLEGNTVKLRRRRRNEIG